MIMAHLQSGFLLLEHAKNVLIKMVILLSESKIKKSLRLSTTFF